MFLMDICLEKAILATRYGTVKASAHDIQRYKESLAREQMEVALYLRDVAAEKIQSAWRGYLGRKKARNIRWVNATIL